MPEFDEMNVKGYLDLRWLEWFAGLMLAHLKGDEAMLSGSLPDQAAWHWLLELISDLNLMLFQSTLMVRLPKNLIRRKHENATC